MYMVTSGATPTSSNSGVSHTSRWDSIDPPPPTRSIILPAGTSSVFLEVGKGEDEQRAAVAGTEHAGEEPLGPPAPANRHGDVLPSVDAVCHRAAVVAATALELPQLLPGAGVERDELSGGLPGE